MIDNGECRFNVVTLSDKNLQRIEMCVDRFGPATVILGDSHAMNLYQGLAQNTFQPLLVGMTIGSCRPHVKRDGCVYEEFARYVEAHPEKIGRVIFTQAGYYLLQDAKGNPGRFDFFHKGELPFYRMKPETSTTVRDYLAGLAEKVDVTWLGPRIEPRFRPQRLLATGCEPGSIKIRDGIPTIFETLDRDLAALVAERRDRPRLTYLSQIKAVPFDPARDMGNCHSLYWSDPVHWSQDGELYFGARLAPVLLGAPSP
jgi:hypothetical protein